ncbi:MAG: hypothetical protein ABI471_02940 [Sphingomonas bacterium]
MAGISSNIQDGPYNGDGVQTVFPFSFWIATEDEIAVEMDGQAVLSNFYRVTFHDDGGTVTFLTPPALHTQILLRSNPDYRQASSFENEGSYNLATVNLINKRAAIRDLVLKGRLDSINPEASAEAAASALFAATQATHAAGSALEAQNASTALASATATFGVYKAAGSSFVPQGAVAFTLAPGSGGTNGLNIAATFSGGNYLGNPTILFDIVGGAVTNVRLTDPGLYFGAAISAPTVILPGAAGGATLTLTNGSRIGLNSGYWVQSADGTTLDRYKNAGGVATADPSIASIPTSVALAAALAATALLNADRKGLQRTVPPSDLGNGYGPPIIASNGQVTYTSGGAIKGSIYYLSGVGLTWRDAGLPFTARLPIVSGAPASARLIQFNAANTEVGTRPTAVITAAEIGFHGVVLNAATVKLQLEVTSGGSALITKFMAVSLGEPVTVLTDGFYKEAEGYYLEQLNETPLATVTYTFVQQGTDGTFTGGVLTQSANAGASSGLGTNSASFVVGGKYRMRFRSNSRLLQAAISTAYTGDPNAFSWPALPVKLTEIPGDSGRVFYDFQFVIPAHPTVPAYPLRAISIGFYSPTEGVICDDFIAAADFQLPPVRRPPLAVRTYITDAIATALAAGGVALVAPTAAIDLWGDSLIDFGHGAGAVSDALSALLGGSIPMQNLGVATQNGQEIAMRAGGSPVLLSLSGDAIPATTTAVAVSNFNAFACPLTSASNGTNLTDPLAGSLGGIPGVLTSVRSGGNVIGLTFTRNTAGLVVPINKNTPFLPTQGEATRSKYQVLIWGKNDVGGTGGTLTGNYLADLYDRQVRAMLPIDKRFLIGTVLHSNRDVGTEVINDINAAVAARYSRYIVDLTSAPTAEEMATVAFTPTADDLADMDAVFVATVVGTALTINSVTSGTVTQWKYFDPQVFRGNYTINSGSGTSWVLNAAPGNFTSQTITLKGFIPRGMRGGGYSGGAGVLGGDQLHLNTIGNQLWALRLFRSLKQRGWF